MKKFVFSFTCVFFTWGCQAEVKAKPVNTTPIKAEANTKIAPFIDTQVVSQASTIKEKFDWGELYTYYKGETQNTKDVLSAVAIIKPGREIHPPHKHAEEEYLMVISGEGTWTVFDKDFPAKAGDILYAKPWDLHGIKNTGDTPLKFVVFKWNVKWHIGKYQEKHAHKNGHKCIYENVAE